MRLSSDPRLHSSVAQWQSIRLLTGGLLVRVQPEEPAFAHALLGELRLGRLSADRQCEHRSAKAVSTKRPKYLGREVGPPRNFCALKSAPACNDLRTL